MPKLEGYKFLKCDDGIYFGKPLKNGNISKDAVKIESKEIIALFETFLKDYRERNQKEVLEVERNGRLVLEARYYDWLPETRGKAPNQT